MAAGCRLCGAPLPIQVGRGRRRTKCEACSPPKATRALEARAAAVTDARDVVAAVTNELTSANVLGSVAGQSALILAARLHRGGVDGPDGLVPDSGSAVAAMVKELRTTMVSALAREIPAEDPIDEIAKRRAERRAGLLG